MSGHEPAQVAALATVAPLRPLALEHLLLHLRPINRALRVAAQARADRSAQLIRSDPSPGSITEQHMLQLFEEVDRAATGQRRSDATLALNSSELQREAELARLADRAGADLPIVAMQRAFELGNFELAAVLVCAAPQISVAYNRIFAFVHDDLNRLAPSVELMTMLASAAFDGQLRQQDYLAAHGKLRRLGLLQAISDPPNALHSELTLGTGVLRRLVDFDTDWVRHYRDKGLIPTHGALPLALFPDAERLGDCAALLRSPTQVLVGLWGPPGAGGHDTAIAIAADAGRMLRCLPVGSCDEDNLTRELRIAERLGAVVLVDADALPELGGENASNPMRVADLLARHAPAIICIGAQPWHPIALQDDRATIDVQLTAPDVAGRTGWWQAAAPDASDTTHRLLAGRYRFSPRQMRAATASVQLRADSAAADADRRALFAVSLPASCRSVSMQRAAQFAKVIIPRRQPHQLILPPPLHERVIEVASFFKCQSQVDDGWGFGRLLSGGGMKVLMTGDSGTGKTAAAEVIAGQVAADQLLLKVNLASITSKWVGETEKNLDAVFDHAEESHAALFFDEADALFAKRGEVERGADRYANLEVGFLLQRLEEFAGLAILASNHKDQLDEAFMRRFQVILHFPRPTVIERRKLWAMALPPEAPLAADVDLAALDDLDLTGAAIVNAARMAGLLAAQAGAEEIGMAHLVAAVVRQFQHEARLLTPAQLGAFAPLVTGSA